MSDGGKGSAQRPTDQKSYSDNWEVIFGRGKIPENKELDELVKLTENLGLYDKEPPTPN